jgi:glycyl-tRNA synthetase alpha subunit
MPAHLYTYHLNLKLREIPVERLVVLQGVKHFKDIQYTPSLTYGELLLQNEYEMSCYNMDQAEVATQQQMFKLHEEVWHPFAWTAHQAHCRLSTRRFA